MVEGQPAFRIHRRCKNLRKALGGAWHYKRMQVTGEDRFHEKPDKNHPYSDCGDALGYLLLGGGEHRTLSSAQVKASAPAVPTVAGSFNPLARHIIELLSNYNNPPFSMPNLFSYAPA